MASPTIIVLLVLGIIYFVRTKVRESKLPPGPRRLPFIGNLLEAPGGAPWVTWAKLFRQYGPLVSLNLAGMEIILIGEHKIAKELLDKRGNIYNDRPHSVMVNELTTKGDHLLFKHAGEHLSEEQRIHAPLMSPRASQCYKPVQDLETKVLLHKFLGTNDFTFEYERLTASIIYTLCYGTRVLSSSQWNVKEGLRLLAEMIQIGNVGARTMDSFPVLKFLPKSLSPWKKRGDKWHEDWENVFTQLMHEGMEFKGWNFTKDFRAAKEASTWSERQKAFSIGVITSAAYETTTGTLEMFTLACVAYGPSFIPQAQAELDAVVGADRLPDFDDLTKLPLIECIIEETLRWRHIIPGGIPHATTRDDYYNGYLIPKGAVVVPVLDYMQKNPSMWKDDPAAFIPERWVGRYQPSQTAATGVSNFGFGRRICTGRHIATNTLRIAIARLLWAFNIRGDTGKAVDLTEDGFTEGFVSHPKKFGAIFELRGEERKQIIEREYEKLDFDTEKMMSEVREKLVAVGMSPRA